MLLFVYLFFQAYSSRPDSETGWYWFSSDICSFIACLCGCSGGRLSGACKFKYVLPTSQVRFLFHNRQSGQWSSVSGEQRNNDIRGLSQAEGCDNVCVDLLPGCWQ